MPSYSWGYNYSGILGRTVTTNPLDTLGTMAFPIGVEMVQIEVSETSGVGLATDGTIYVWGLNRHTTGRYVFGDQFGTSADNIFTPTALTYSQCAGAVEVGISNRGTFWRKSDGTVWGVGTNFNGEFGTGEAANTYHGTPVRLTNLSNITRISVWHDGIGLFAVDRDGALWFAGLNRNGAGVDTVAAGTAILTHTLVFAPPGYVVKVTMGYSNRTGALGYSAHALMTNNTVTTWGMRIYGTTTTPQPIVTIPDASLTNMVQDVYGTAGSKTVYFLLLDGSLKGYGSDYSGALAAGTFTGSTYNPADHYSIPTIGITIPGGRTVTKLAHGSFSYAMFVITNDDQIWGWGLNDHMWGTSDPAPSTTTKVPPIAVFPSTFYRGGEEPSDLCLCQQYCPFVICAPPAVAVPSRLATIVG